MYTQNSLNLKLCVIIKQHHICRIITLKNVAYRKHRTRLNIKSVISTDKQLYIHEYGAVPPLKYLRQALSQLLCVDIILQQVKAEE